jgi:hypothetical protein
MLVVAALAANAGALPATANDDRYLTINKIGRERRQSIKCDQSREQHRAGRDRARY